MTRTLPFLLFFGLCISQISLAQQNEIKPQKGYFGVDTLHKIVVWNTSHIDTTDWPVVPQRSFQFDSIALELIDPILDSVKDSTYTALKALDTFKIYTTKLPIIHITPQDSIVNEPKRSAQFLYSDFKKQLSAAIGIELRGNSALLYPKKSYDMELREAIDSEKSMEAKLAGLRKDDDWQFNSLYNEPLKLRSYFANKLWLAIHNPHYAERDKDAKSGIDVAYVEVFLKHSYQGLYVLNEQIDRKQLQLKKMDSLGNVRGELFKASSFQNNTSFTAAPAFRNIFPHWGGFEVKYPYENYEAHWEDLHGFVNFVATAEDAQFIEQIGERFQIDNAVDYFLFTNLLRATDNLGKNYFIARHDQDAPYFFVPWDLDGILGIIQDGKRIQTTDDIVSNHLFDRLQETNAANYNQRLRDRWTALRQNSFSNTALHQTLEAQYQKFMDSGLYEREGMIWPTESSREDDYHYMITWLEKRLTFLDTFFAEK